MATVGPLRAIALAPYTRNPLGYRLFKAIDGIAVEISAAAPHKAAAKVSPEEERPHKPSHNNKTSAVRQAIAEHKRTFVAGDRALAVMPEGTTSNGRAVVGFFSGAFEGGGSVQPVAFSYPHTYFNGAAFLTTLPAHICRALLNPWQRVHVQILPRYDSSDEEAADPALFAENVRQAIASAASLPLSSYDARRLRKEWKVESQ